MSELYTPTGVSTGLCFVGWYETQVTGSGGQVTLIKTPINYCLLGRDIVLCIGGGSGTSGTSMKSLGGGGGITPSPPANLDHPISQPY